jgi:hypothetical protein
MTSLSICLAVHTLQTTYVVSRLTFDENMPDMVWTNQNQNAINVAERVHFQLFSAERQNKHSATTMGRKEPPELVDTPQRIKRARLSWDPDNVPEGCEILTPSERRLVDINTTPGLCLRKLRTLPMTSRNCNLCAFHGKHFVPDKDRFGSPRKQMSELHVHATV